MMKRKIGFVLELGQVPRQEFRFRQIGDTEKTKKSIFSKLQNAFSCAIIRS